MRTMLARWTVGPSLLLIAVVAQAFDGGNLLELLDQRLELMDEVAAHKWLNGLPVEDREREAVVLEHAVEEGLRHGLTPLSSRRLFAAQIEAAKSIQHHWFARWARDGGPASAPDLQGTVRPELLRLGSAIAAAAGQSDRTVCAAEFDHAVAVEGLSPEARDALLAAVRGLERYSSRLEQILGTGVLRVGTTGDYAPFSHRAGAEAPFTGIDIDLARRLAAGLGVQLELVPTSWPRLMADLQAGAFDIAMGGISRILERQKHAYLSVPYYVGGKVPIARCDAEAHFSSLEAIDRAGVRVVVNPGGTNERFVDANLRRAEKILHEDNRTIFERLIEGDADVMITDRVEAELQAGIHPELCVTMAETLTYQEKAYLLPQDGAWLAFVNTWLELALADGTVARVFGEHGIAIRHPPSAIRYPLSAIRHPPSAIRYPLSAFR